MLLFQDVTERLDMNCNFIGIDDRTIHYQTEGVDQDEVKAASDWCMMMAKAYILSLHGYDKIPENGINLPDESITENFE